MNSTRATFWVQIARPLHSWKDARATALTQRRPRSPEPGTVLIKLTVVLPEGTFVPREFAGEISIGPGQLQIVPQITAEQIGEVPDERSV